MVKGENGKTHCIMGVSLVREQQRELNGKLLVYGKTESEKKG
jgi:hypothetical protein